MQDCRSVPSGSVQPQNRDRARIVYPHLLIHEGINDIIKRD